MASMPSYEAAIADIYTAKAKIEIALEIISNAQPLGTTARVLNPRHQLLAMLPAILGALSKCEDAIAAMLEDAHIGSDRSLARFDTQ